MSASELKRCPFCGGEAHVIHSPIAIVGIYVSCKNCHARTNGDIEEKIAISAWNRRAGEGAGDGK